MAASTGLVLTAGVITFANEWLQLGKPNWRIAVGTLGSLVVFAGIEKLDERAAVGLAAIVIITVLIGGVTPGVKSPAAEVLSLLGKKAG
jgi:hypothetical protein